MQRQGHSRKSDASQQSQQSLAKRSRSLRSSEGLEPKELEQEEGPPEIATSSSDEEQNNSKEGVYIAFPLPAFALISMAREVHEEHETRAIGKRQVEIHNLKFTLE